MLLVKPLKKISQKEIQHIDMKFPNIKKYVSKGGLI